VGLDAFDEAATIALAEGLSRTGRRVAARDVLVRFAHQLRDELDEGPSSEFSEVAETLSASHLVKF
jgi:DNA-binding SARP family transcriptional activator